MNIMRNIMDFEFDTRKVQNMHFHQNQEIIYVLEGAVDIQIESETYSLEKGEFLLVNANKRHSLQEKKENLLIASFQINFSMLSEYLGTNQILFWCNTTVDKSEAYDQLRKILDRILNKFYDKEKEGALYLNSIYYEALYVLTSYFLIKADDRRLKQNATLEHSRVIEIQNYVQSNYQKQISLNDLANKLYLSNAYLSKYIKKRFGMSFLEYVNNIRLFHAVDELLYTDKKITRIALDNGFPTTASFNKAFKEVHHMTPSAYRQDIQKDTEEIEGNQEPQEKIEERIKNFLAGDKVVLDETVVQNRNLFVVDAKKTTKLEKNWSEIINVGKIESLLDSNMQQQILLMQKEIGFRYVRVWNLFVQDMFEETEGDWHYNFSRVDRGLDFLVDHQLIPFIELSFKPINVSYTIDSPMMEKENDIIFQDLDSYRQIMKDFAAHLINRYGVEEVEKWCFEVWKDARMNILDEEGWYFECFRAAQDSLKRMSNKIKIGGPGFALGYDRYQYRSLIRVWKKQNIVPDFISVYSYSYELLKQESIYFGKRSLDSNFLKNQLELFKQILREEDYIPKELYITEWNSTVSNRNCINDSCAQGAYVMKTCMEAIGKADKLGFLHGSDLHSEFYDTEAILYGDNGMLSKDGIKKPTFYAFHFLHFLQSQLLGKTENAVLSTNSRGVYTIVCHNCKQFNYRYTMKEEQDIRVEDLEEVYEDLDAIHLKFNIENVENGEYVMRIFYINQNNGSVQDIWKNMGFMKNLSKGEVEYVRRAAMPKVDMRKIKVEDGVLRIETKLMAHEMKAIDIHYLY